MNESPCYKNYSSGTSPAELKDFCVSFTLNVHILILGGSIILSNELLL